MWFSLSLAYRSVLDVCSPVRSPSTTQHALTPRLHESSAAQLASVRRDARPCSTYGARLEGAEQAVRSSYSCMADTLPLRAAIDGLRRAQTPSFVIHITVRIHMDDVDPALECVLSYMRQRASRALGTSRSCKYSRRTNHTVAAVRRCHRRPSRHSAGTECVRGVLNAFAFCRGCAYG